MKQVFITPHKTTDVHTIGTSQPEMKSIETFMEWLTEVQASGNNKSPSQNKVLEGRAARITDGPYVEIKELIGKFFVHGERKDSNL